MIQRIISFYVLTFLYSSIRILLYELNRNPKIIMNNTTYEVILNNLLELLQFDTIIDRIVTDSNMPPGTPGISLFSTRLRH